MRSPRLLRLTAELCDLLRRLAIQEQIGACRSRRDRVHRDVAAAQLICQDRNEAFDSGLGGNIGSIGWEGLCQYAAGESDNASAFCHVLRCLCEYQKGTAKVGGNDLIKGLHITLRNG